MRPLLTCQMTCWWTLAALSMSGAGCADPVAEPALVDEPDPAYFEGTAYLLDNARANVLRRFEFLEAADGVAVGFDLDGRISDADDEETCHQDDLTDPSGQQGVDNQLAKLWPALAPLVGEAVQELLQGAINEGRFLLAVELEGDHDGVNGEGLTLHLYRALTDPDIGTFGLIAPDQTFYLDYDKPVSVVEGVSLVDGEIHAGPVDFEIPIEVLEASFLMRVRGGQIRFTIAQDGTYHGALGGAINVADVLDELYQTNARAEAELVTPIFVNNADLGKVDGACTEFSMALGFEGTRAFVVRDSALE